MIASAYVNIREKFSDELKAFCDDYDVQSILEMWNGDASDRAVVVVGDCGSYMNCASGERGTLADNSERSASCRSIF